MYGGVCFAGKYRAPEILRDAPQGAKMIVDLVSKSTVYVPSNR